MPLLFEKVPEVLERDPSLEEALSFHRLTRARMTAEVIRWMESIRLEDPVAWAQLDMDPDAIRPLILKWDFVFSTGMTTDYPKRRNWTHWMALREFIQNALDVEERVYGYKNMAIKIFHDEVGVHVVDRGPGITLEAFKLGGSDKGCEERGFFGEGLKVAAAHFAGENVLVYVFNRQGQAFKMCLSPGTNLVVVVMGRAKYPPIGTEVILHGATISPDLLISTIFQEWMRAHPEARIISETVFSSRQCAVPKPNIIVAGADNVDLLWVRDIFVNPIKNITGKAAIFGYNLWWIPLEPNRVTVASQSEFASQAAKAFTPEAALLLIDRIVEITPTFAKLKTGFFETDVIDWWSASDQVKDAVGEWVKNRGLGATTNERATDWIAYMGVTPLLVPQNLTYFFARAPEAEAKVLERSLERLKSADASVVPEEALTLEELEHLGAGVAVLTWIHRLAFWGKRLPDIVVVEKLPGATGVHAVDKIYLLRGNLQKLDSTFSTLYHEYCHHYGDFMYGEARDLSEAFQKALTEVAGLVAEAFRAPRLVQAYSRALHGGWKANALKWEVDNYELKPKLLHDIFEKVEKATGVSPSWLPNWTPLSDKIESSAPVCVAASTFRSPFYPEDITLSRDCVRDVIPENLPPSRELYRREVEKIAEEEMPKIEKGIIFMYDPWVDSYEVLRRIGL